MSRTRNRFPVGRGVALLAIGAASCAYTSEYVAPPDGRGRVVWQNGAVVAMVPSSSEACLAATEAATHPARRTVVGAAPGSYYYVPDFPLFVVDVAPEMRAHGHVARVRSSAAGSTGSTGGTFGRRTTPTGRHVGKVASPRGTCGGGSCSGLGSGSGGSCEDAAVVVAAAAIVVAPAIAIGLAVARPEEPDQAAAAVRFVDAFNTLSRAPSGPCVPPPPPAIEMLPVESTEPPAAAAPAGTMP